MLLPLRKNNAAFSYSKIYRILFLFMIVFFVSCKKEGNTIPDIILLGNDTLSLQLNDTWTDTGFVAADNEDGDISDRVVVTGTVNTTQVNWYPIEYSVTDNAGNQCVVKRNVCVRADSLQGNYRVNAIVTGTNEGNYTYNVTVLAQSEYNYLQISNFCDLGNTVKLRFSIQGPQIIIPMQTLSGVSPDYEGNISGQGTYDGIEKKIVTIQYTLNYLNGGSDAGSTTFVRN